MVCPKCGKEYSAKVYRIHAGRCGGVQEEKETEGFETVDELTKAELIDMAEGLGIDIDKRWSKARIAEAIDG